MIVTILEAHVAPEKEGVLRQAFAESTMRALPDGLIETFLLRDPNDPARWRLASVWTSEAAPAAAAATGRGAGGASVFREAGAEPTAAVWEVAGRAPAAAPHR